MIITISISNGNHKISKIVNQNFYKNNYDEILSEKH